MHQTFPLLLLLAGFFYVAECVEADGSSLPSNSDNVIVCDYDRDLAPVISLLKEKYPEYLNLFPCRYLNPSRKSELAKDNGSSPDNHLVKDGRGKRSMLLDVPINRGERYFADRTSMFATRNPIVEGYKRGPGFRSWGGKRTVFLEESSQPPNLDKRNRFSSWGGKRSEWEEDAPNRWLRLCDSKETCEDVVRKEFETYNPYDLRLYLKNPSYWTYRNLLGSKRYQS